MASIKGRFVDSSAESYLQSGQLYRQFLQKEAEQNRQSLLAQRNLLAKKIQSVRKRLFAHNQIKAEQIGALVAARHLYEVHRRSRKFFNTLKRDCLEVCFKLCAEFLGSNGPIQHEILANQINKYLSQQAEGTEFELLVNEKDLPLLQQTFSDRGLCFKPAKAIASGCCEVLSPALTVTINWRENLKLIISQLRTYASQKYPD